MKTTLRRLKSFSACRSGVAAVEFALVAPVLILLYAGSVDVTRAVTFHRKLMHTAASIGDLVAQSTEITQSDVASIFTVSNVIMSEYSNTGFAVKVTGVTIDELGHARVEWSIAQGMAADHSDMSYILPEGLRVLRNQALIITDTSDVYVPLMNVFPNFAISMKASARNRSRGRVAVNCTDCN